MRSESSVAMAAVRHRGASRLRSHVGTLTPVADTNSMLNLIAQLTPGEKAKMTVLRKNKETTLDVTVGKRPANPK